jgi:hypothetical protein
LRPDSKGCADGARQPHRLVAFRIRPHHVAHSDFDRSRHRARAVADPTQQRIGAGFGDCVVRVVALEADLPLIGTVPDTPQRDAGIDPDVLVTPSVADIARGVDTELTAARARADAGRRPAGS